MIHVIVVAVVVVVDVFVLIKFLNSKKTDNGFSDRILTLNFENEYLRA